jgi:3'-phosphoadenosine 5'-phosphosulfate sulfotransferase (PAPS reductase)/FAD synthetase
MHLPLYYSWRAGGFEWELLKEQDRSRPVCFETPAGTGEQVGGTRGKISTRRKFPQQSANPSTRWCSGHLKIDVYRSALNNQARFLGRKTLVISGERAEESAARKHYNVFEPDHTDNRHGTRRVRWVDRWRPIHSWTEEQVWQIIERHKILPHPAYRIGWGRLSCAACIFGSDQQWASLKEVNPTQFDRVADYEEAFGVTIDRKKQTVRERIAGVEAYKHMKDEDIEQALAREYWQPITTNHWTLPMGAFGDASGPL